MITNTYDIRRISYTVFPTGLLNMSERMEKHVPGEMKMSEQFLSTIKHWLEDEGITCSQFEDNR
jgi:hypothetical protein